MRAIAPYWLRSGNPAPYRLPIGVATRDAARHRAALGPCNHEELRPVDEGRAMLDNGRCAGAPGSEGSVRLQSHLSTRSDAYRMRRAHGLALVEELDAHLQRVVHAGGERAAKKLAGRDKLSPRERVERLLDRDGPFLELSALAGIDQYDDECPGGGCITGIGQVAGKMVVVFANDTRVKGGAIYPVTADKLVRAQRVALDHGLPTVSLVESAGANLLYQAELFALGSRGGRGFCNQARMSAAGLPQVSLVFGNSTAGGAYVPGMSDYTVMVRGKAKVFLAGPPLVKAATGEETDDESLGGAEMHHKVSGLCDYIAEDDADAIRIGRDIVANLGAPSHAVPRARPEAPAYDPDELLGVVPEDLREPFDIREVIARVVDGSRFDEFRRGYGETMVTGFAHIDGYPVGVLGNNGPIFSSCALKATHFIQLCCQKRVPIVYLQNITGFMVGLKAERGGIIKDGAKLVHAVSTATVPQFTVLVGGSFGAGNYGMCGRAFDPYLLLSWPQSRIAVMGGPQAARTLRIVQEQAMARHGMDPSADEAREELDAMEAMVREEFERTSNPWYATSRLWDDGVIDPRHTRAALAVGLRAAWCRDHVHDRPRFGFGVLRM
jgi:3-methylcrotonyl-CoA carboxylase beta subunit